MNSDFIKNYAQKMTADTGRRVTLREAEDEVTRIILEVTHNVSPAFRFGYHSKTDIAQEGAIFALELLEHPGYDFKRPLAGFIYVHVRNRLSNYRRKHYMRTEPPCKCCDIFNPPLSPCGKWKAWNERNIKKQNLMRPLDVYSIADENERTMRQESTTDGDIAVEELMSLIDENLPVSMRADYLKLRSGVQIPKTRMEEVRAAIMEIIDEDEDETSD